MKKDPELYEVFDYFRKVLIDELDNADIKTTEGQTIKTAVVTAAEKVLFSIKTDRIVGRPAVFTAAGFS